MAKRKPTIKEIEAKVEVLTKINNQVCQMVDNLGSMVRIYIEFKGDSEEFPGYYLKKVEEIRAKILSGGSNEQTMP